MKVLDKAVAFIYLLIIGAMCVFFIAAPMQEGLYVDAQRLITDMFDKPYRWYVFIAAILLLALTVKVILGFLGIGAHKKYGVIKPTENGEVFISNDTLKAIVLKAISSTKGIKDTAVYVSPGRDSVSILIKTTIQHDINIPQITAEMQVKVKDYIQSIAEVPVGEVKISVVEMSSASAMRVE